MDQFPKPPETFLEFQLHFPKLGKAWELLADAGKEGPLDNKTARLVKLAIAIGNMREGAVHSCVRKARAIGITRQEIDQVISLAAGTLGMPATVAIYSWVQDELDEQKD